MIFFCQNFDKLYENILQINVTFTVKTLLKFMKYFANQCDFYCENFNKIYENILQIMWLCQKHYG